MSLSLLQNVPGEIKKHKSWVCVKEGSKVPMQSSNNWTASSTDPDTWSLFETAYRAVRDRRYAGIGYVFHDQGVVGIDIDDAFDSEGFPSKVAVDVIRQCQSYTEISVSGNGLHVLVKGELPFSGRNNMSGLEIYQSRRYFLMTGNVLLYKDMITNQPAIDYILAHYFTQTGVGGRDKAQNKLYKPIYGRSNGKLSVRAKYPKIHAGGRNNAMTSLAGQLHLTGLDKELIYDELLKANMTA